MNKNNFTTKFGLTSNGVKIIAIITMFIDHFGLIFFPKVMIFRCIGRIAFPLFAYCIAEGCYYTKNKLKFLLNISILACACDLVYIIGFKQQYACVLTNYALSIVIIYIWQKACDNYKENLKKAILYGFLFMFALANAYYLNYEIGFKIDYAFYGMLLPVLIYIFKDKGAKLCMMTLGVLLIIFNVYEGTSFTFAQTIWSLVSVVIMMFYNGERGTWNMKYAFYLFYPLHLVVLYGLKYFLS